MEEKNVLRNKLFDKYFENKDGILLEDLVNTMNIIKETWKKFHEILEENIPDYDSFSRLEMVKLIEKNNKKYLFVKLCFCNYLVIDLSINKLMDIEKIKEEFDEQFFIDNFEELKRNNFFIYDFIETVKSTENIIDFYISNKEIFDMPSKINYKIKLEEAWSYLYINFANAEAQLGFNAKDQYLYEQLYMNSDLTPSIMQDAVKKIGKETMDDMFNRIKKL